jgi:hypothetical protein
MKGTSSTSIGAAATAQQAAGKFTTTHWSMVLEAQSESPVAQEALEKLCRIYWQPIYSFVQRQGIAPEEAVDFGSVINCYCERKLHIR